MSVEEIIQEDVPLAPRTTVGLGGRARYFAVCTSVEEIRDCLSWSAARNLPVQVLGGGSNIVFPDEGFPGVVLEIALQGIDFSGEPGQVRIAAGEEWDRFVQRCVERGLAGVECLSGIPGRVGATPIQNVGAYGQEVAETIAQVRALDRRSLGTVAFAGAECGFGYRRSRFKARDRDRYILIEVTYRLRADGRATLRYPELRRQVERMLGPERLEEEGASLLGEVRKAVLDLRRRKSMLVDPSDPDSRSAGSFFLNPVLSREEFESLSDRLAPSCAIPRFETSEGIKLPAAWLVEQAGYPKGYRHKGAGVSARHALALVNRGGSSRDLLELAEEIQRSVLERFGIRLEREPVVVEVDSRFR